MRNEWREQVERRIADVELQGYQIRTRTDETVPLRLNAAQRALVEAEEVARALGLRGVLVLSHRQMGLSTLQLALARMEIARQRRATALVLTYNHYAARKMVDMARRFSSSGLRPTDGFFLETSGDSRLIVSDYSVHPKGYRIARVYLDHVSHQRHRTHPWAPLEDAMESDGMAVVSGGLGGAGEREFARWWLAALEGNSPFLPFFFPWWRDPRNVAPLESAHDLADLTPEDRRRMVRYGLSPEQINWYRIRRKRMTAVGVPTNAVEQEFPDDDSALVKLGEEVREEEERQKAVNERVTFDPNRGFHGRGL